MSFHTPPHKHVGDEGKPGQIAGHLYSSDNIPSPTGLKYEGSVSGRISGVGPNLEEIPKQRTNGDRMLETLWCWLLCVWLGFGVFVFCVGWWLLYTGT